MRTFNESSHLIDVSAAQWQPLRDEFGNTLDGIRGKAGACGLSAFGHEMGVDLIEMESGSAFPPHVHEGDHLLFVLDGSGVVTIDDKGYQVKRGDSIFIAAEYPHAVSAPSKPCAFLACGHPHKPISARDRMKTIGTKNVQKPQ